MDSDAPDSETTRRRFLAVSGKAFLAVLGVLAAATGLAYFYPPVRKWAGLWKAAASYQAICAVDSLPAGKWQLISFETARHEGWKTVSQPHSAWVRRDGDGPNAIRVFSSVCPHNGCALAWRAERSVFVCPCHGGTFNIEGAHQSGPPRRSMDPLDFRVENRQVLIQWQEFKNGLAKRVPAEPS